MNNIRPLMKRVFAYLIDLSIIYVIVLLLTNTTIFKNKADSYQKTYSEYVEKYDEYSNYLQKLETSYEDSTITEEEYNELINNTTYKDLIISKYEDSTITKGEYKEIIQELNNQFDNISEDYAYLLNKKGAFNSIITLVITLLYFGVLQYFLKGQTIGKKIVKLKVVPASDKKINILNYLLRSLLVNDIFLNTISIFFLLLSPKNIYLSATNVIEVLVSISEAIIVFLVLTREDQRGLHDLLFNTKVIDLKESKESNDELSNNESSPKKQVIDTTYEEKVIEEVKEDKPEHKETKSKSKSKKTNSNKTSSRKNN